MKRFLTGMAATTLLAGLIWTMPAAAAPISPKAPSIDHQTTTGLIDVARRHRVYRRYYPRNRYYRPYASPYYGQGYYPDPYYRPYYRPGFYIGTPFFGFGF